MTEVVVNVHNASNTSFLRLRFTGGLPNVGGGIYPAIYMETERAKQRIIEDSREFKSGFIFIHKVYGTEEPEEVPAAPVRAEEPAEAKVKEYPEVTDKEGLIAVLKANGAKAATLLDDEKMAQFIAKKGLSFPNYEL